MRINCKFSIDYLLSCAFLCHISILVFFLHKFVDLWSRGHLITPQELATMIIPKGELTSLFDLVKRAGVDLSLSDASCISCCFASVSTLPWCSYFPDELSPSILPLMK